MSKISFFSDNVDFVISDEKEVSRWLIEIVENNERTIDAINVIFLSDDDLLSMNERFLKREYYTDIITFQNDGRDINGELYISVERVRDNANKAGLLFVHELHRVLAHGLLHLLGFDDKTEEEKSAMRRQEEICLNLRRFNVPRETK